MRQEVQLYIDGKEIFFSESPEVKMTYQRTDYSNPTAIKNSYSKTITIEGTKENNKVFNGIYNLDRIQDDSLFNPSRKVPFELYHNGEIYEQGYVKLNNVRRNGRKIEYEITLFGELGEVFYNLAYDDNGDERQLSSLIFRGRNNTTLNLDFTINKTAITNAWRALDGIGGQDKYRVINFAPCYNGLPDDFDSDKVIIKPSGTESTKVRMISGTTNTELAGFPTSRSIGGTTYGLYNNYALAELPENMTADAIRDYRSYLQRPVLNVKETINAIIDPDNNGGYTFVLDDSFFNSDNPYWNNAWVTLPKLTDLEVASSDSTLTASLTNFVKQDNNVSTCNVTLGRTYENMKQLTLTITPKVENYMYKTATKLYTSWVCNSSENNNPSKGLYGGFTVQILGYQNGSVVEASNVAYCYSDISGKYIPLDRMDYKPDVANSEVTECSGYFVNDNNTGLFSWNKNITLTLNSSIQGTVDYKIKVQWVAMTEKFWDWQGLNVTQYNGGYVKGKVSTGNAVWKDSGFRTDFYLPSVVSSSAMISTPSQMCSNAIVTKKQLLNSLGISPCNFLLSYCKLFNLYFDRESKTGVITIKQREEWYDGIVYDVNNRIDRDDEIKITPLSFDAKWYQYVYNMDDESEFSKQYKEKYNSEFGIQKVNTGYNFDNNSKDLLSGVSFNNAVQALEQSRYFQYGVTSDSDTVGIAPFLMNNTINYKMYAAGSADKSYDITLAYPTAHTDYQFSSKGQRYDAFDKMQFHTSNNEPIDGAGVLCFYTGKKTMKTAGNEYSIYYNVTDDFQEMITLNGNRCWYYSTTNDNNCSRVTSIPQFSRYYTNGNTIVNTWDFGRTKQLYIPKLIYATNNVTIYERYWMDYITDLYDVDTRLVDCSIQLKGNVVPSWMKHFFWFDNALWALTKISDYNVAKYDTTKCTFTKVNNPKAYCRDYVAPQLSYVGSMELNKYSISSMGGTVTATIKLNKGNWSIGDTGQIYMSDGTKVTVTDYFGKGDATVQFTIPINPMSSSRTLDMYFLMDNDEYVYAPTLTQSGSRVIVGGKDPAEL